MTRTLEFGTRIGRADGNSPGRRRWPGAIALLAACFLVSACTLLPRSTDPSNWFEEETPPPTQISAAQDLDQAQSVDFPNLASVPDKPRPATPEAERTAIAAGLAADRSNAVYSGERLVAGSAAPAEGAPAAPALARDLGAPGRQAAGLAAPAAVPAPEPARPPAATEIVPAPAPTSAQSAPDQGLAQRMAQADVEIPAPAARTPAWPQRSELAGVIYFAHGSYALDANDRAVLRDIVALSRERDANIRVIGHASARTGNVDPTEHRIANLEISQRRADSVVAALVRLGAARDRVRAEARADTQPVYHEFMPTGEAGNRRAEVFLEY